MWPGVRWVAVLVGIGKDGELYPIEPHTAYVSHTIPDLMQGCVFESDVPMCVAVYNVRETGSCYFEHLQTLGGRLVPPWRYKEISGIMGPVEDLAKRAGTDSIVEARGNAAVCASQNGGG